MIKRFCFLSAAAFIIVSLISCSSAQSDRNAKNELKYFPVNIVGKNPDINLSDSLFLNSIAKDTWKFFENSTYGNTGFVVDKIFVDRQNAAHYTSITNIGLYLVCTAYAYKLNYITRNEALNKINTTIKSLLKLERYKGFFYNWYEIDSLKQSGNYISTVDAGWLYSSLFIISNIFTDELGKTCNKLIDDADFLWLYDEKEGAFRLGYDVKSGFSPYHYKLLVSEARIALYLAVIKNQLRPKSWFKLARTLDKNIEQEQYPKGGYSTYEGEEYFNGYYMYDSLKVVPSWGGSMFEFLMTDMFIDERMAIKGMGLNNFNMIKAQIDFCLNKNNYKVWGMSPCATPDGGYGEFGVYLLGTKKGGYPNGVVTPHASCLALNYYPKEVLANLKNMIKNYSVYGEYGFYDCVDMKSGEVGKTYLALDQSMIFISIANYLTDNYIPNLLEKNSNLQDMFEIIKKEEFYK
jgi:hypothetical protein